MTPILKHLYKGIVVISMLFANNIMAQQQMFSFETASLKTTHENLVMLSETVDDITMKTRICNTSNSLSKTQNNFAFTTCKTNFISMTFDKSIDVKSIKIVNKKNYNKVRLIPIHGNNKPILIDLNSENTTINLNWKNIIAFSILDEKGKELNLEIDNIIFEKNHKPLTITNTIASSFANH